MRTRAALARRRFTLVELLFVIAILSILAAMLLPSLASTVETARQTSCMNNLKQMAVICNSWALDHHRKFPQTWRMNSEKSPWPPYINGDEDEADDWKTLGTTWGQYEEYGIDLALVKCPSSELIPRKFPGSGGGWGYRYTISYMIVSGLGYKTSNTSKTSPFSARHGTMGTGAKLKWEDVGTYQPAYTLSDLNPAGRLLLADNVWWGGTGGPWGNKIETSHPSGDILAPVFQAHAFADGHVIGKRDDKFLQPLYTNNYSVKRNNKGAYFYWSERE